MFSVNYCVWCNGIDFLDSFGVKFEMTHLEKFFESCTTVGFENWKLRTRKDHFSTDSLGMKQRHLMFTSGSTPNNIRQEPDYFERSPPTWRFSVNSTLRKFPKNAWKFTSNQTFRCIATFFLFVSQTQNASKSSLIIPCYQCQIAVSYSCKRPKYITQPKQFQTLLTSKNLSSTATISQVI